jgi:hypothetical protein
MDSVGTSLRNELAESVVQVDASGTDLGERLKSFQPELIVFELDTPRPCAVLSLLRERPGTLLLGIDRHCNQVIALHSERHPIENMAGLCRLAQAELDCRGRTQKGGNELDRVDDHLLPESSQVML